MTEDDNVTIPLLESDDLWSNDLFNKNFNTVILVTGWTSNINEPNRAIDTIYNAYKARGGYNFVVIDTAEYVDTLYTWSAFNTNDLGKGLADGLQGLIKYVPLEKIHLIGKNVVRAAGIQRESLINNSPLHRTQLGSTHCRSCWTPVPVSDQSIDTSHHGTGSSESLLQ